MLYMLYLTKPNVSVDLVALCFVFWRFHLMSTSKSINFVEISRDFLQFLQAFGLEYPAAAFYAYLPYVIYYNLILFS
jgi:hypothetical protein